MTRKEAIKLIDDRMCFGRGKWSAHHMPVRDIYWEAGEMAIKALEQLEPCDDTISRQAAIDILRGYFDGMLETDTWSPRDIYGLIEVLPSAQPEISRIEQELHGKTPEEQYEFLYWLLLKFGLTYTDSRLAVIEWLRGEKEDG